MMVMPSMAATALGVEGAVQAGLRRDVFCLDGCCAGLRVVDAGTTMVVVVFMILMVVVAVGREVVLSLLLVGQELVDEAFCLAARRYWRAAEVGWDRLVGDEGALAAVGVGRVEDDLLGVSRLSRTVV